MAKKATQRCPSRFGKGKKGKGRDICFKVERVQRNGHKGYVTAFHLKNTGALVGYSGAPGACRVTRDPFQASIRPKAGAERAGQTCARVMTKK